MSVKEMTPSSKLTAELNFTYPMKIPEKFFIFVTPILWHPGNVAAACLFADFVCCGLSETTYRTWERPDTFWQEWDSDYAVTIQWQRENFPDDERMELALFEADNILTPEYIRQISRIRHAIREFNITDRWGRERNQSSMCASIPALGGKDGEKIAKLRRSMFGNKDPEHSQWSLAFPLDVYCMFYNLMPTQCFEVSILDIWGYDETIINQLTQEQILNDINTATKSLVFDFPMNYTKFLGGVSRNSTGHVVGAKVTMYQWFMKVNRTDLDVSVDIMHDEKSTGMEDGQADKALLDWESEWINVLESLQGNIPGFGIFYSAVRSYGEVSGSTILGDVWYLIIGDFIFIFYVQVVMGKFNLVESRGFLSCMGILSTVLACSASFGLCQVVGIMYGPVHSILPLIMLGLGVDDMFVIMQSMRNLPPEDADLPLPQRMGSAMRHAGVAITVTSLTDFAAFAIGASTVLPALRSFCIYSAVGILFLYMMQSTFFVAWFTLDQKRILDHRNGSFPCIKHRNWTPNECSQRDLQQMFFDKIYSKFIVKDPVRVCVILATIAMTAVSIWGVWSLRIEFNLVWFIPQSSYLFQFLTRALNYFPEAGEMGTVYFGNLSYAEELPKLGRLTDNLNANPYVLGVDSWYDHLHAYTYQDTGIDIKGKELKEDFFNNIMGKFLFSEIGSRFKVFFHFAEPLICGEPISKILSSSIEYQHKRLDESADQQRAMDDIKQLVRDEEFSAFAAPLAMMYSSYETDRIIGVELYRNLGLAMLAVLIMTMLLIANVITSFYVLICVTLTVVNVMALMAWWGLTIDIVSCINIVLCIGLCVDYSAHIGLHFMTVQGTRKERVSRTVREIGPPVFNGALSTVLAFIVLARSDSHVFVSFFKIFFGVFIYGVYHGLVFLPVLLSYIGPNAYSFKSHPTKIDAPPADILLDLPQGYERRNSIVDIKADDHIEERRIFRIERDHVSSSESSSSNNSLHNRSSQSSSSGGRSSLQFVDDTDCDEITL
ncbi:unnamed protein product, partial [Meganyctiphanes norvegica]